MTALGRDVDQLMKAEADHPQTTEIWGKRAENKGFLDHAVREAFEQRGPDLRMDWVRILGDLGYRSFLGNGGIVLRGQLKSGFIFAEQLGGGF